MFRFYFKSFTSFLQVHAVFFNEQFKDSKKAKATPGGVTVIAVQVQVGV